jgi:cation:H+ antiporter
VVCAIVIIAAGSYLTKFADQIAEITNLGRLLIGSILLAGATSLPELTVDISAVRMGMEDLAAGDLLGSSLMNLMLLAALDLTHYSRGKMLSRLAAVHALSGAMSITLTALVGLSILAARQLPQFTLMNVGVPSMLILVAYSLGVRMVFLDQRISVRVAEETTPTSTHARPPLWKPVAGFAAAALVVVITGPFLAKAAGQIAELSGIGTTFVGTTFVALSTSFPELVATLAAIRMGAFDLAVGNIFGSNTFNMLLFVPLDALQAGPLFLSVSPSHLVTCLATIVVTAVAIMGQLYNVERRRPLIEPDGLVMVIMILAALALVYRTS